jgi:hypothetical protein
MGEKPKIQMFAPEILLMECEEILCNRTGGNRMTNGGKSAEFLRANSGSAELAANTRCYFEAAHSVFFPHLQRNIFIFCALMFVFRLFDICLYLKL